jgi:hypothetical protein
MIQSGYTKLFGSIVASTIWREDDKTRIVWITLLALSDKDGYVAGSIPGLADLARVSVAECEQALEKLQQPDKYSRSPEHDGRRLEVVDGGWFILNRAKYRDSAWEHDKIERHRGANRRYYQRKKNQNSDRHSDSSDIRKSELDGLGDKKEKEKEKEKELKPLSVANAPDAPATPKTRQKPNPKHRAVKELIEKEWAQRNQKTCPWGPAAAKQLDTFLNETMDWTVQDYRRCIENRYASDGVVVSEDPKVFISHLPKYLSGPLNQFGQPKDRGSGSSLRPHVEYQDPSERVERQLQQ